MTERKKRRETGTTAMTAASPLNIQSQHAFPHAPMTLKAIVSTRFSSAQSQAWNLEEGPARSTREMEEGITGRNQ
jgi:hypothetical protein